MNHEIKTKRLASKKASIQDDTRDTLKHAPCELSDSDLEVVGGERLYGCSSNDSLQGGNACDTIIGGLGSDIIIGGDGNDVLFGGSTAREHETHGYNDAARDAEGHDYMDGGAGNDWIFGGDGNDTLHGGTGDDTLLGNADNDELYGDAGDDNLKGGEGSDTLYGGEGRDILTGGQGSDVFAFGSNDGSDTITDFNPAEDRFQFTGINDISDLNVVSAGGMTIISYGDTQIILEGVELTAEEVWALTD